MRILLYALIFVSLLSCGTKKYHLPAYIISKEAAKSAAGIAIKNVPPPIPVLYSSCNIILSENNKVYIHCLYVRRHCITSLKQSKPDFLGLMPSDFLILNSNQLIPYLDNNIFDAICSKGISVSIASPTDTITHPSFKMLVHYLQKKGLLIIRRTTEEENYVLKAKKEFLDYNPEEIKWVNGFYNMNEIKPVWELRKSNKSTNYRP